MKYNTHTKNTKRNGQVSKQCRPVTGRFFFFCFFHVLSLFQSTSGHRPSLFGGEIRNKKKKMQLKFLGNGGQLNIRTEITIA